MSSHWKTLGEIAAEKALFINRFSTSFQPPHTYVYLLPFLQLRMKKKKMKTKIFVQQQKKIYQITNLSYTQKHPNTFARSPHKHKDTECCCKLNV